MAPGGVTIIGSPMTVATGTPAQPIVATGVTEAPGVDQFIEGAAPAAERSGNAAGVVGLFAETCSRSAEDIRKRLLAPMTRGTGWMRISATPQEAVKFHREYAEEVLGETHIMLCGNKYKVSNFLLSKAKAWARGGSQFERTGYFLARQTSTKIVRIIDFIPLGSIAIDPERFAIASQDKGATQVVSSVFAFGGIDEVIAPSVGIDLAAQESLSFQVVSRGDLGLISIPFHSHHDSSNYSESPSPPDMSIAKNRTEVLYSVGSGKLFFYDSRSVVWVPNSGLMPTEVRLPGQSPLDDLFDVGTYKSIGHLPLDTIEALGVDLEELISRLRFKGMQTLVRGEMQGSVATLYSYDSTMLEKLLARNRAVLAENAWPTDVPGFVEKHAQVWVSWHSPINIIIAEAYGSDVPD